VGCGRDFGFYSENDERLLKNFKQNNQMYLLNNSVYMHCGKWTGGRQVRLLNCLGEFMVGLWLEVCGEWVMRSL
jgi:hypothetical protein